MLEKREGWGQTPLGRAGGWLFRHRTALPLPIAVALLAIPSNQTQGSRWAIPAGVILTSAGELLRLWGVWHIGVVSRTRSNRLGPLIESGPFAFVRNPLYLGNIALWVGFALVARLIWLTPLILVLLATEYHAIVRWEEALLESRLGDAYRDYAARVPRWVPTLHHVRTLHLTLHHRGHWGHGGKDQQGFTSASSVSPVLERFSVRDTFFSERGTLIAMAAGYLLLWLKARF